MKIHTNTIDSWKTIMDALNAERESGRIASHVSFKTLDAKGSRTHKYAYEIQLEAAERDRGRRAGNSGSYGAMRPEYDGYAATYDEWGWLLAALFEIDPDMVVGTVKYPVYKNREDFDEKTAWSYNPKRWLAYVNEWPTFADERDPFPIVVGNGARTKRGYFEGRFGANRMRLGSANYWGQKEQPRTVAEFLKHAHMESVDA